MSQASHDRSEWGCDNLSVRCDVIVVVVVVLVMVVWLVMVLVIAEAACKLACVSCVFYATHRHKQTFY